VSQPVFDQEVNAKVKKNLLKFGIFSIIMIFAGLTSAYIVSRGSEFWVEFVFPAEFMYSTVIIVISSVLLYITGKAIKQNKQGLTKALLGLTFGMGVLFCYFQAQGWNQMFDRGLTIRDNIINQTGKYGQFYSITYQTKEITYDGYDLIWKGAPITPEIQAELDEFCEALLVGSNTRNPDAVFSLNNYGTVFILKYVDQVVTYANDKLYIGAAEIDAVKKDRLYRFAESLLNRRGDFMMSGKYGVDFKINYKGKPVTYENRNFYIDGKLLKALQLSELNGLQNKSSQYTLMFIVVHAAHLIFGLIALLVIWIRSILGSYSAENYLGIQLGTIYWHFLGILWIYLYAFLIFIH
jgi:cytochrome c oxidase subunit 3